MTISADMPMISWSNGAVFAGRPAVLLDRDGVINERIVDGYVTRWEGFRWRPTAIDELQRLSRAQLPLVVVSNQSCVRHGLLSVAGLTEIMHRMVNELRRSGVEVCAWYCCPHLPDDGCECRKPRIGMFLACARDLRISLARSYMIGDTASDEQAGIEAGCKALLVDQTDPGGLRAVVSRILSEVQGVAEH